MKENKRFDRVLAVLVQLQSKRVVTAQELAARFGVSLRTVYRDIRSLENAGIPLYGEAGLGYSLVEGFRMAPAVFTKEEALSFGVAEKLMQTYLDRDLSGHFASAFYKMKAVLRSGEKEVVSAVEQQLSVRGNGELFNHSLPEALSVLFASLSKQCVVSVAYQALDAETSLQRDLEPVGVFYENNFWYFMAFCHLRSDYRQFRLDRLSEIRLTTRPFVAKHQALSHYLNEKQQRVFPTVLVRIAVDKAHCKYLEWDRNYYGFQSEVVGEEEVEMLFLTRDLHQEFARWFLMFGDVARIVEPEALKQRVRELSLKNLENIKR